MRKLLHFTTAISLLIFPSSILVLDGVGGFVAGLTVLIGIACFFLDVRQGEKLSREEKIFFLSVSLLPFTAVLTSYLTQTDLARGDRFLSFALIIPIYLLFRRAGQQSSMIWLGVTAGAFIALAVGVYQVFGPESLSRATGVVHPIIFGDLSLMMGMISIAGTMWFLSFRKWALVIPVIGLVCGLLASALSLSRGGWVAIPLIILVYILFFLNNLSIKKLGIAASLILLALSVIYFVPQTGVQKRVDSTLVNLQRYMKSENVNDPARATSIGSRFEMWRSAWSMYLDNPVFGGGWGEFKKYTRELIKQGKVNKSVGRYYHAHNEYLSVMAKGGTVNLVSLLILLFVPAFLFIRKVKSPSNEATRNFALGGLLLIAGFASFALSEAIFERSRPVIFFAFYLAVFMAGALRNDKV